MRKKGKIVRPSRNVKFVTQQLLEQAARDGSPPIPLVDDGSPRTVPMPEYPKSLRAKRRPHSDLVSRMRTLRFCPGCGSRMPEGWVVMSVHDIQAIRDGRL